MSPRSMRRAIIRNPRARCARGLIFRSTKYKRTLRRRLPRGGPINRCAMSISARPTSLLALCIAESWTYRRRIRAEHDLVSEVYHVIDGSGTLVLGPDILDMKRRPPTRPGQPKV